MVRVSVLPAAAVALFLFGADASPCRPSTTGVTSIVESSSTIPQDSTATSFDSTAVTTVIDATTTVQEESTETTTETSLAESMSTTTSDATITSDAVTTTTLADSTTTAEVEPTTTTAAPACDGTQLFDNRGFDDSDTGILPWTTDSGVLTSDPQTAQSPSSYIAFSLNNGGYQAGSVTQTLRNLRGSYLFSYYQRVVYANDNADYVCDMQLKVGDVSLRGAFNDRPTNDWTFGSVAFTDLDVSEADVQLIASCSGEYNSIQVNIDTLGFNRICSD